MADATRAEGERTRIDHAMRNHRAILSALEIALGQADGPDPAAIQAFAHSASDLACSLARLHAYVRVEEQR